MDIQLEKLELIAQGGQSKIYKYDNHNILRVPQRSIDSDRVKYEFDVYQLIHNRLTVPHVTKLVEIDAKPCIIMENIKGSDFVSLVKKNPLLIFKLPKKLAQLHNTVLNIQITEKLVSNHSKASYCISNSQILDEEQKRQLLTILNSLDSGSSLCHGDFHPGNIIRSNGRDYIIDWSSASYGSKYFDIAHTYLLMINIPRLPNVSNIEYRIQQMITKYIGVRYLRSICKLQKINSKVLWQYFLIKIAERTFYGMDSERPILYEFLKRNLHIKQKNIRSIKRLT